MRPVISASCRTAASSVLVDAGAVGGRRERGPEDHSLKDEYDILLTEPSLRAMIAAMGKGPRGARIIRRTVRISDLGRELWEAARSPQDARGDDRDVPAG